MKPATDNLEERRCPACAAQHTEELFHLSMAKVFQVNPTYNEAWFDENTISPDFEFPIVRCKNCRFVFSQFKMKDEIAFRYYNEGINAQKSQEKVFKKNKRTSFIAIWQRLNRLSEKQDHVNVLDFGAGWGDFLAIAKSPGVDVFGLEFDQRKIAFAQSQGIPTGNTAFIRENAPYDIFMCNQVLEHLTDPKDALRELRTLLSPGSVGFVSVPAFDDATVDQQAALLNQGLLAGKNVDPLGHLNYFTPLNLRSMVQETGFEEIVPRTASGSVRSKLSFVYKLVRGNPREKPSTSIYVRAV